MEPDKELWIQVQCVNATKGCRYGDDEPYETRFTSWGRLYRDCAREYGRCQSKVYIDKGDKAKAIGWVFVKRVKYTDCNEWFTQEAWVTVHTGAPIRTIDYQYA